MSGVLSLPPKIRLLKVLPAVGAGDWKADDPPAMADSANSAVENFIFFGDIDQSFIVF